MNESKIDALEEKARRLFKQGDMEGSQEILTILMDQDGVVRKSLTLLRARVYRAQQCYDQSLSLCEALLQHDPTDVEALLIYGLTLLVLHRYAEALQCYLKIVELRPEMATALYGAGLSFNKLGKPDKALPYLNKAIALDPNLEERMYFERGQALVLLGQLQEGILDLMGYVESHPDHFASLGLIGTALIELQRYDDALIFLDKALSLSPGHSDTLVAKATVLYMQHRPNESRTLVQQVLQHDPSNQQARDLSKLWK